MKRYTELTAEEVLENQKKHRTRLKQGKRAMNSNRVRAISKHRRPRKGTKTTAKPTRNDKLYGWYRPEHE